MNLPLFSIAPMMDYTDRHCRYFMRLISPHIHLYTEMITTHAILHGDRNYLLDFDPREHYVAMQVGGSDPEELAQCARIVEQWGYDEINLNVGCPSDRVQKGRFGACLMAEPELVANCVSAMKNAVNIPVTVKTRIGIDDKDSYEELCYFIEQIYRAGCEHIIVHARKAWLQGLSPKENREIPPLRYEIVQQLKKDFSHLKIIINGGIKNIEMMTQQLTGVDGIMIGREAYSNPYLLAEIESHFYQNPAIKSREEIVVAYAEYVSHVEHAKTSLSLITRPVLGLFHGTPGARHWRRFISENAHKFVDGAQLLKSALQCRNT